MPAQMASFVLETATNPGTGSFTLNGAASDRLSFGTAFPNGGNVYYFADDGTQGEWGIGTLTIGNPNTLARTTVISTTAGSTAALKFSGTVNVYNEVPGERLPVLEADGSLLIGSSRADKVKSEATVLPGSASVPDVNGIATSAVAVTSINVTAVAKRMLIWSKGIVSFADGYSAPAGEYAQVTFTLALVQPGQGTVNFATDLAVCANGMFGKIAALLSVSGLVEGVTYAITGSAQVTNSPDGNARAKLSGINLCWLTL